ncbi:MAG: tyrosine-type recombinase/integrase, partial [Devosia sp.]|nr:tyrosine-type recombinase/integrase [Devosia sp.]
NQSRDGELVFPSAADADKAMGGYHKMWLRLAKMAALPADVTPHVLRHSFASEAFGLGLSELTIAFLLGHKKSSVTQGYIHADATLLRAADLVADHIAGLMGDAIVSGQVVDLGARRA